MFRAISLVCAGGLLLVAAGCSLDSFGLVFGGKGKPDLVIQGSPEVVALSFQSVLSNRGLMAIAQKNGDRTVVRASTQQNQQFFLVFDKKKTDKGEATRVQVDWNGQKADEEFFVALVQEAAVKQVENLNIQANVGLGQGGQVNVQAGFQQPANQNWPR